MLAYGVVDVNVTPISRRYRAAILLMFPLFTLFGWLSASMGAMLLLNVHAGAIGWADLLPVTLVVLVLVAMLWLLSFCMRRVSAATLLVDDDPRFARRHIVGSAVSMVCVYLLVVACAYHVACVVGGLGPVPFYEVRVAWGSASTHVTRYNLLLLAREDSYVSEGEVMYAYEHTYAGDRTLRHSEATDRDGRVVYVASEGDDDPLSLVNQVRDACAEGNTGLIAVRLQEGKESMRCAVSDDGQRIMLWYGERTGGGAYFDTWRSFRICEYTMDGALVSSSFYDSKVDGEGRVTYTAGREYDAEGRLTTRFEGYDDFGSPRWVELDMAQTSAVT